MTKRTLRLLTVIICICAICLSGCRTNPNGWADLEAGRYYFKNGTAVTGWQEIDGNIYRFLEDGLMVTGHQTIDDQNYYFDDSGIMATGWQLLDGNYYYFRENGSRVSGWLSLNGVRHYLYPDGRAASGPTELDGTVFLFDLRGALTSGWTTVDSKRYYSDENGHPVTGWQEIDGVRYLFDESYSQQTGWVEDEGFCYYFLPGGQPARGNFTIDGKDYTFAFNGQLVILVNPWNTLPENYTVELQGIGNNHQIADYAVSDYRQMMADCRASGLNPVVCSSYRTQEYQQGLYDRRIQRYVEDGYTEEEATTLAGRSVAVPGTSEHQLGLALDIIDSSNWNLDETQADTPTQKWLMEHSWEYGWILRYPNEKSEITGIIYEPWHYRYVGKAVAADIHNTGLCLEEYLESLSNSVG